MRFTVFHFQEVFSAPQNSEPIIPLTEWRFTLSADGFLGEIGRVSNVNGMLGCAGYVAASAAYAVFCPAANMDYFSLMLSNISKKLHSFKSDTIFLIDISESLFDILVTILLMVTSSTKRCLAISLYFIPAQS